MAWQRAPPQAFRAPLIARYVFVELADHQIPEAAHLDGAVRFFGNESGPYKLDEKGLKVLRDIQAAEALGAYDQTGRTDRKLAPGDRVVVSKGPFTGIAATIMKLSGKRRAQIITSLFGRSGAMTIDLDKLDHAPHSPGEMRPTAQPIAFPANSGTMEGGSAVHR